MAWLENLLVAIAMAILERAMANAKKTAIEIKEKIELDKQRGETNAENVGRYNDAKTKEESLAASLDLLNRVRH